VADGRLYVAQREAHTVHALNAADGSPSWQYTAGGRVDSPPTIHGGMVYFGSADGWVTCLRAEDGKLAWRFRAAPESRQIVSYDQLESVWPVHGNVLVIEHPEGRPHPVAYAAAGRSSYVDGGVHLVVLNAATGELLARRRISHRDAKTGLEPQNVIRGTNMPGAMPDVLATDGASVFMRHQRLDLQFGTQMSGGYGGWTSAGNRRVSGRLLVRGGDRLFGFGRKSYAITGSHGGLEKAYHLFAADTKLVKVPQAPGNKKRRRGPSTKVKYHWSQAIPFYVRAMVLAGDVLFIAGPRDIRDLTAARPGGTVHFRAVSAADGSTLAERTLRSAPVYDSFAATKGRLYFATVDDRVVCYAAP
jgi:hypothetical protein